MQDIIPPSREEALAPLPTGPTRRRRSGLVVLGLATALGLGLAGGLYLNRFVDLDLAATWVCERLQPSFEWARREVVSRIESLTTKPAMVAQASSPSPAPGASQPAPENEPNSHGNVDRLINDLSARVDQVRAAGENSARDLSQGLDRLRASADQNQREVIASLVQLRDRLERIERQAKTRTGAAVTSEGTRPVVHSAGPPPARPSAKTAAKPVHTPAPEAKAKVRPRQPSTDPDSGPDERRIANWTVLDAVDGTAVLNGPQGMVEVSLGDSIPGIGRVQAIMRSGRRWIVATSRGVITTQ